MNNYAAKFIDNLTLDLMNKDKIPILLINFIIVNTIGLQWPIVTMNSNCIAIAMCPCIYVRYIAS